MSDQDNQPSRLSAEHVYMIRYEVQREADYRAASPEKRAGLHGEALDVMRRVITEPGAQQVVAEAMARHARMASEAQSPAARRALVDLELHYLVQAYRKALGDYRLPEALSLAERLCEIEECSAREKSEAMIKLCNALRMDHRLDDAVTAGRKAVEMASDEWQRGWALQELANTYSLARRLEESQDAYEQALRIAEEGGDTRLESGARVNLGSILRQLGRPQEALLYFQRAADQAAAAGSRDFEGTARLQLGFLHSVQGNKEEARGELTTALENLEGTRRSHYGVDVCNQLADIAMEEGKTAEAESWTDRSLSIARALGYRTGLIQSLNFAAMLYDSMGRDRDVERTLRESVDAALEVGDAKNASAGLGNLAFFYFRNGELEKAESAFLETIQQAETGRNQYTEALAYGGLGDIRRTQGREIDAWNAYEHAKVLMDVAGYAPGVVKMKIKLARQETDSGELEDAIQMLREYSREAEQLGAREEYELANVELAKACAKAKRHAEEAQAWTTASEAASSSADREEFRRNAAKAEARST